MISHKVWRCVDVIWKVGKIQRLSVEAKGNSGAKDSERERRVYVKDVNWQSCSLDSWILPFSLAVTCCFRFIWSLDKRERRGIYRDETLGLKCRYRWRWVKSNSEFDTQAQWTFFSCLLEARSLHLGQVQQFVLPSIRMRPAGGGLWQDATHPEVIVVSSHLSNAPLDTTRLLPPPPDYSFLDRWVCARWRSEISIIQDTDQQRQQLGESEDASLKIWARKMKIEINEFKSKLDLHSKGSSPDLTYKNFVPVTL